MLAIKDLLQNFLTLICFIRAVQCLDSLAGNRFHTPRDKAVCTVGAICVGPGGMYPLGRQLGAVFSSSFVVPELPAVFNVENTTYYDYLNIFWRKNPPGGYMNQFVPQLMLGNALANSSNYPDYNPYWIQLSSWHIGAQYFMGLCPDGTSTQCQAQWTARAATGDLIPVEPGEEIETIFRLVPNRGQVEWQLSIGVKDQPDRTSVVVVDTPFMGLLAVNATSWMDDLYDPVYVGSCLENYGMMQPENFPDDWFMTIVVDATTSGWQRDWFVNKFHHCDSWEPPKADVVSWEDTNTNQRVLWEAQGSSDTSSWAAN